jgi:hypothetical protein
MIKNIISLVLLIVSAFISFRHGWTSLNFDNDPEQSKMIEALGINKTLVPNMGAFTILVGLLLLFPKTFFLSNMLTAMSILTIMGLALHAGQIRIALIEIPFLIMPLGMIWLKYPFIK